eukprot:1614137-Pyramimonas_sp.AAC.1
MPHRSPAKAWAQSAPRRPTMLSRKSPRASQWLRSDFKTAHGSPNAAHEIAWVAQEAFAASAKAAPKEHPFLHKFTLIGRVCRCRRFVSVGSAALLLVHLMFKATVVSEAVSWPRAGAC